MTRITHDLVQRVERPHDQRDCCAQPELHTLWPRGDQMEYESAQRICGIPLIAISTRGWAVGAIAVGRISVGLVSVGVVAVGPLSVGVVAAGLVSVGVVVV